MLKEALEQADAIRVKQEAVITEYKKNTLNFIALNELYETKIRAMNEQLEISDLRLKTEQSQRLSIGVFAGFGMGNANQNIQAQIGIGISYQIFKIKI